MATEHLKIIFVEGEVNINEYLLRQIRGKYSPKGTEPEINTCFCIIFNLPQ